MITSELLHWPKRTLLLFLPILLVGIVCFPKNGFAQKQKHSPIVTLGNIGTTEAARSHLSKSQVIADPVLKCGEANCEVTGFTISIAQRGEQGAVYGPFKTNGARIKEEQLNRLRTLTDPNIRIFIENIHVKYNGEDLVTYPIILNCNH